MKTSTHTEAVQIREYRPGNPEDATAFRRLNEEWLIRYFVMEPGDHLVLGDPVGQILATGGVIFLAETSGQVVGCCALLFQADDPQTYKFARFAVTAEFQGRQIGRALLEAAIFRARALGAERLFLVTNSVLIPARHLYESMSFTYFIPEPSSTLRHYARGDTFMELRLD